MDYEKLLDEYMQHVYQEEGTDFVCYGRKPDFMTDEEWESLEQISKRQDPIEWEGGVMV